MTCPQVAQEEAEREGDHYVGSHAYAEREGANNLHACEMCEAVELETVWEVNGLWIAQMGDMTHALTV